MGPKTLVVLMSVKQALKQHVEWSNRKEQTECFLVIGKTFATICVYRGGLKSLSQQNQGPPKWAVPLRTSVLCGVSLSSSHCLSGSTLNLCIAASGLCCLSSPFFLFPVSVVSPFLLFLVLSLSFPLNLLL